MNPTFLAARAVLAGAAAACMGLVAAQPLSGAPTHSDNQTRSMLQTDQQYPSVSSQTRNLKINAGGSVDIDFGPRPLAGEARNWIQTVPDASWNMLLRLYGPFEPWFNKTWRPGEIELRNRPAHAESSAADRERRRGTTT